ncbi:MAG: hypothetical protein JW882_11105 [Deltaproteobacteria bacterium]|nr:hypothetical protein [Deltaproteobacteria bacterium]
MDTKENSLINTGKNEMLIQDILSEMEKLEDAPVEEIIENRHLIAVTSINTGLCTRMGFEGEHLRWDYKESGVSAKEMGAMILREDHDTHNEPAYGMAAINSLLKIPDDVINLKAQELILKHGKGKNAAVIGHFPFVEKIKPEFHNMWVLEKNPKEGDLPAESAEKVIPDADFIAITATTLLNGTCAGILKLVPEKAFVIMLGPSTPFASCLFDWGIDALASCVVTDKEKAFASIREGYPSKWLAGIKHVIWMRKPSRY